MTMGFFEWLMRFLRTDPIRHLVNVIGAAAILVYYAGILYLGFAKPNADALKYASAAVTGIGGTLATFFGGVVGLGRVHTTLSRANLNAAPQVTELTWLQILAAWAYILSLFLAVSIWMYQGFSAETADTIRNLALTLPGVVAGILTVAINVGQAPPQAPAAGT
jgi:hypothetical protein